MTTLSWPKPTLQCSQSGSYFTGFISCYVNHCQFKGSRIILKSLRDYHISIAFDWC